MKAIGNLSKHWHVLALSREIKPCQSLKRSLYGTPLLIWRDLSGSLYILDDCCAHRRAPIEVKDYQNNRVVCPYHGWEYDETGHVCRIPSDPKAVEHMKCFIQSYYVIERHGFIWIHPNGSVSKEVAVNQLDDLLNFSQFASWTATFKQLDFATTEELLIENFMDPTHTALVHDGIIRNSNSLTQHEMTITTHSRGVRVEFAEREEQVGFGMRFLFGRSMRVKHTDEFLLPNLVRVTYEINDQVRFVALIACTPIESSDKGRTLAFVQLRYDFGTVTKLISPIISLLANKVIKQDLVITSQQFANQLAFPNTHENRIGADAVSFRVAQLRRQTISGVEVSESSSQIVSLYF